MTRGRLDVERGLDMVIQPCKLRGRSKEFQVVAAMCAVRRVIRRGTAKPKVTADNPGLETVGRTKQVGQEQRRKGASSVGNLNILHGSASRGGQGSSVVVLRLQYGIH